jgi:hypothetical protein
MFVEMVIFLPSMRGIEGEKNKRFSTNISPLQGLKYRIIMGSAG